MVKPRYMSLSHQSCCLNYFNSYAVKDRIDLSSLSNFGPLLETDVKYKDVLPSAAVDSSLMHNMAILVSRMLVENLLAFRFYFEDAVVHHILHPHTADMNKKSEVVCTVSSSIMYSICIQVSLGVFLHSEQKYDEMLCILDKLYHYVPKRSFSENVVVGETDYSVSVDATHTILFGGDQMTAARCRGCKTIRSNSDSDSMKLNGFHPVSEDWHAKVVLLEVYG